MSASRSTARCSVRIRWHLRAYVSSANCMRSGSMHRFVLHMASISLTQRRLRCDDSAIHAFGHPVAPLGGRQHSCPSNRSCPLHLVIQLATYRCRIMPLHLSYPLIFVRAHCRTCGRASSALRACSRSDEVDSVDSACCLTVNAVYCGAAVAASSVHCLAFARQRQCHA